MFDNVLKSFKMFEIVLYVYIGVIRDTFYTRRRWRPAKAGGI